MATTQSRVDKALETGGPLAVIQLLTEKQLAFVEEYVKDFNGQAALSRAGYNVTRDNSGRLISQMKSNPAIKIALAYYVEKRAEKSTVDSQYVMKQWIDTIDNMKEKALTDTKAAAIVLRASELIAKSIGMFIERTEITGKDGEAIQIEEINDAADAFTRQITRLNERGREDGSPLEARP